MEALRTHDATAECTQQLFDKLGPSLKVSLQPSRPPNPLL